MNYRSSNKLQVNNRGSLICDVCKSSQMEYRNNGTILCKNCGQIVYQPKENKYHAKKSVFNDRTFDSNFEASVACQLEELKMTRQIIDYDCQFKISADVYNKAGYLICKKQHKVDFRVMLNDRSYLLVEAKGVVTADYQWRRDIVVGIWLSEHKDYAYQVVKTKSLFIEKSIAKK